MIVGYEDDSLLYKKEAEVTDINWISQEPKFPLNCEVRLRHRQPLQKCTVCHSDRSGGIPYSIKFKKPQRAVTPGQFAVFYKKGECLGGGAIEQKTKRPWSVSLLHGLFRKTVFCVL